MTFPRRVPTTADIERIVRMDDAPLRNLWITWSYFRLNQAMRAVIGEVDLSWCGFATWASRTAGTFIRLDDRQLLTERWVEASTGRVGFIPKALADVMRFFHDDPAAPPPHSLRGFAAGVMKDVSTAIAVGNQVVFQHIAPPFAELLARWEAGGGTLSDVDREAFLTSLRRSDDPTQSDYLAHAFEAVFAAVAADDPRRRAQAILGANAWIGLAEQTRVQPYIARAMNSPILDMFKEHTRVHLPVRLPAGLVAEMEKPVHALGKALEEEFHDLSTEWMMRLEVPGQSLRLGHNVPPLPDGEMYPRALATLDAPDPLQLFERLRATDAQKSAARDWVSLDDRMTYIGVLFRSRQQQPTLWDRPFTPTQIAELEAGRMPTGAL